MNAAVCTESKKAMNEPDVAPKLEKLGLERIGTSPEEHGQILRRELDTIGKLVKAIGLQPE